MEYRSVAMMAVLGAGLVMETGCVERQVAYVPVYQAPPAVVQAAPVAPTVATAPPPAPTTAAPAPLVTQPPPAAPVEVIPVAPGPEYVWTPGYYAWQGGWVWVRGCWVVQPHPHALWIGGHRTRHAHGWVWVGGHWR